MHRLKALYILLMLVMINQPGFSQQSIFRAYTVSQGLSNNAVRRIFQDSKGYIWISTWEGLNKYDGSRFTTFNTLNGLPHDMVNDICEIGNGIFLVALNNGITVKIAQDRIVDTSYISGIVINHFFRNKSGALLAVTDQRGIIKIADHSFTRINEKDNVTLFDISFDPHLGYFAASEKNAVILFDEQFRHKAIVDSTGDLAETVLTDLYGRTWLGTEAGLKEVVMNKPGHLQFKNAPAILPVMIKSGRISALFQDVDSSIWIGTHTGLFHWLPNGSFRIYTEKDGLPGMRITSVFRDREQNLWVGTYAGLAKMSGQAANFPPLPIINQSVNVIWSTALTNKQNVLLFAYGGLYKHNRSGETFFLKQFASGEPGNNVASEETGLFIDRGTLYQYDEIRQSIQEVRKGLSRSIYGAAKRGDYFATANLLGVQIFFPDGHNETVLEKIRFHRVIFDGEGNLWAGSWNEGLYLIKIDSARKTVGTIINQTPVCGSREIRSMLPDHLGRIWIGTRYEGLKVLHRKQDKWTSTAITQADGILSGWIYSIAEDHQGNIWAGSLGGINKISFDSTHLRVFNFSRITGIFATISNFSITDDGLIWCASDKGLFNFRDEKYDYKNSMEVYLTHVNLGGRDSSFAYQPSQHATKLPHSRNFVNFEFTSPGFINETELLYTYRLIGSADTNWSSPANIHNVQYASLNPGKYRFEVRMIGWNGEEGHITSMDFRVSPPWWQTWWFFMLSGLAILGALSLFYRYRIRQIYRLQQVRNNIATDLHDDIGSTLTNISILSQLSINQIEKPAEAKKFLSRIRDEVQNSSEALDDIIWSVNSRNDSLEEMLARMRRYAADLFDNSETRLQLEITNNTGDKKLNMEQRRDLFLIYKESLTNIHKHAAAKNVKVRINVNEQLIHLELDDDGLGFNHSLPTERNGLKNIKYRVEKWNGSFDVHSVISKGTRVDIEIPVSKS